MRLLCLLFLVALAGVVGVFAYQNNHTVDVKYLDQTKEVSFPILIGATYVIGMLSGWTVVGMVRRSWRRVEDGYTR